MYHHFEASALISQVPAWGDLDLDITQKKGSLVRQHCLSVRVAPRSEGRRGILCDANELSGLTNFAPKVSDSGNVYLGCFVAVRAKGATRIAFQPSKDWEQAQLHLRRIFLPEVEFDSILGGEDEGETLVTDAPF